jgi:hypothetical protein
MTPKEKAKEILMMCNQFCDRGNEKMCAEWVIDKIIDSNPTNPLKSAYRESVSDIIDDCIEYWQEVKNEIQKL